MRTSRFLLALGVMLVGLCAALPFRRSPPPPVPLRERAAPLSLTLRRPDTPLELAPQLEASPAVGLADAGNQRPETENQTQPRSSQPPTDLAHLFPPPALPVSFQPSTINPESSSWRPEPVVRPSRPPALPRPYRLRDGDTLEKIAERLLGNIERANEIFELNRGALSRPDLLPVGVTIMLPPRENPDDLEPVAGRRE